MDASASNPEGVVLCNTFKWDILLFISDQKSFCLCAFHNSKIILFRPQEQKTGGRRQLQCLVYHVNAGAPNPCNTCFLGTSDMPNYIPYHWIKSYGLSNIYFLKGGFRAFLSVGVQTGHRAKWWYYAVMFSIPFLFGGCCVIQGGRGFIWTAPFIKLLCIFFGPTAPF